MYSFDEGGNVLIDRAQAEIVSSATRARTLSRRASALTQNQFIPFQPISGTTWSVYQQRLGAMFTGLFQKMKVPTKATVSSPRGGGDFRTVYFKMMNDWASTDLQGFRGPIPAVEINGLSEIVFLLPADGAVIRYLGRLLRKYPGFFNVQLGHGNMFNGRVNTLDSSVATMGANPHGMCIRVKELFGQGVGGRTEANVGTLRAILRTMDLADVVPGINQILTTLSRKIKSTDGAWGEDPKFPIVNFMRKVPITDWLDLDQYAQNFHGNNKDLYSDKNVYGVIALGDKLPFVQANGPSGDYKWTQPRS